MSLALNVAVVLSLLAPLVSTAATQQHEEISLPRGHFYPQAGGDTPRPDDGFLVADRPGFGFTTGRNFVRFGSEFERHGGVAILGYPASRPFVWDGFDVQVFQKSVLQWRPEAGSQGDAWSMNVFDEFTRRGLDQRLLAEKQVPLPGSFNEADKSFDQIMRERLDLLRDHPALLRQFWSVPDPLMLYGLPSSNVEDFGPFYAVRLQRAAFQEWKVAAPGIANVGDVTVVNAGDAAKEFGLIPDAARLPVAPPAQPSEQIALFTPGRDERVQSPFDVAGDARAFEATVLWELTDTPSGDVLGRGFTTADACCEWSSFELLVPYAISGPVQGTLAVWGASGRDASERPGEVRVRLELENIEQPAAAKDGELLIEPLGATPNAGRWSVRMRLRNESGSSMGISASRFGLRDAATGAVSWADTANEWSIPAGESREVQLEFGLGTPAQAHNLRLLHRARAGADTRPVVVDVPDFTVPPEGVIQPSPVLQQAIAAAARETGVAESAVQVLRAEQVDWPDASLGCPRPGVAYAQVVTPGWRIVLRAAQRIFVYHADMQGRLVLCDQALPLDPAGR
jgi:hypothetical protein